MRQARQPVHSVCVFVVSFCSVVFSLFVWNWTLELHDPFRLIIFASCEMITCLHRGDEGAPLRPVLGEVRPLGEFDRKISMLEPSF